MSAEGFRAKTNVDQRLMGRALELACQGEGRVEPNPMVGCIVVRDGQIVGEGWHRQFGGPHAEIEALQAAGEAAAGATLYVTLEPCCHTGKTPPCTQAIIAAKVARVVVGCEDPSPQVAGSGLEELRAAGIQVQTGILEEADLEDAVRQLIAPFAKLVTQQRPWIIAKWAMTLDGKLATHTGSSKWISGAASRAVVHRLRSRVDAIVVGRGTAEQDDPLLTARPSELDDIKRIAMRIVLDSAARLSADRRVLRCSTAIPTSRAATQHTATQHTATQHTATQHTATQHTATQHTAPVIVATGEHPGDEDFEKRCQSLRDCGVEIMKLPGDSHAARLESLLNELGHRQMTNVLVEGGSQLFGTLLDLRAIDEVHAFIAPKLVGGAGAPTPFAGQGIANMADALQFETVKIEQLDDDVHIHTRKK